MQQARNEYRRLAAVIVMCVATTFCGGSSPASPSSSQGSSGSGSTGTGTTGGTGSAGGGTASTSCRTGPATYRIVTASSQFTSTINGTCTFNNASVEGTCTNVYTDTIGTSFTSVSTTRHASRGDVVDEIAVIPPLNRALGTTTTVTGAGLNSTGTSVLTQDGQRRLATIVATSTSGGQTVTSTTTYSAWDSSGRPTAGTISGSGGGSVNYSYDNAARTQSSTQSGVTCTQTFDVNGIPTTGTCTNGVTTTFTTLSTLQVCR
ncbi:MAG: hypothetical protein ABL986_04525 [Vicinamibacterales bacterium]